MAVPLFRCRPYPDAVRRFPACAWPGVEAGVHDTGRRHTRTPSSSRPKCFRYLLHGNPRCAQTPRVSPPVVASAGFRARYNPTSGTAEDSSRRNAISSMMAARRDTPRTEWKLLERTSIRTRWPSVRLSAVASTTRAKRRRLEEEGADVREDSAGLVARRCARPARNVVSGRGQVTPAAG
jgi:hypothetical protein